MKESEQPNDTEIKTAPKIYYQEDIDRLFDEISEKTEIIIFKNINPKYDREKRKTNGIYFNLYNHVLNGSINLFLLPKQLPNLKILGLQQLPLKTLKGLPSELPSLERIIISHCPLKSLKFLPTSLPILQILAINSCDLTNLKYFPEFVPKIKEIWFDHNQIVSLKGLPPELPEFTKIRLNNNNLTSLKYLPKSNNFEISFNENPLRTLYNVGEELLVKFDERHYHKIFDLSPRALKLIEEYRVPFIGDHRLDSFTIRRQDLKIIMEFYRKPLTQIAENYVNHIINPKTYIESLSEDEIDRLIWEADLEDLKFLEMNLTDIKNNYVLRKINQRLSIKLPSNFHLLK